MKLFALALLALLVLPLSTGCGMLQQAENVTDDAALFGAAATAWPAMKADVIRGIDDGFADGDLTPEQASELTALLPAMEDAIEARDRQAVRDISWPSLKTWAERGIDAQFDAGEIGPGVRAKGLEHVASFGDLYDRLTKLQPLGA